jgi:hypothetical protein
MRRVRAEPVGFGGVWEPPTAHSFLAFVSDSLPFSGDLGDTKGLPRGVHVRLSTPLVDTGDSVINEDTAAQREAERYIHAATLKRLEERAEARPEQAEAPREPRGFVTVARKVRDAGLTIVALILLVLAAGALSDLQGLLGLLGRQ